MSIVEILNTTHLTYLLILAAIAAISKLIAVLIFFKNLKTFKETTEKFIEHSKTLEDSNRIVNDDIKQCIHELKLMASNHDLRLISVEREVFKKIK